MESLLSLLRTHWDHDPRAWSADLQVGAFGASRAAPSWSSALRFMESLHVIFGTHVDHKPRGIPSPVLQTPPPPVGERDGVRRRGSWVARAIFCAHCPLRY